MLINRCFIWLLSAGFMVLGANFVWGQEFPSRPVRILTSAPGGGSDFASRLIAQGLIESLGQQVIVDNRGRPSIEAVGKSPPDGYNLLLDGASFWLAPLVESVPYDPLRDFVPVTSATSTYYIMVVHPSLPVKSVKDLIALAKAKPGQLNTTATFGAGAANGLAGDLFKSMAGVNIVRVNYKSVAEALTAVIGGEAHINFSTAPSVAQHIKPGGRLRGLAVSSAERTALAPELPTISESGVPGYELASQQGLFATAKTPAAIVNKLNVEILRVLNRADIKDRFLSAGMVATGSSPEQFTTLVKSEMAKWGKVIKEAGLKASY